MCLIPAQVMLRGEVSAGLQAPPQSCVILEERRRAGIWLVQGLIEILVFSMRALGRSGEGAGSADQYISPPCSVPRTGWGVWGGGLFPFFLYVI